MIRKTFLSYSNEYFSWINCFYSTVVAHQIIVVELEAKMFIVPVYQFRVFEQWLFQSVWCSNRNNENMWGQIKKLWSLLKPIAGQIFKSKQSCFFLQNEEIFVQLDELERITLAWIGFNCSLTQAQKTF